MVRIRAASFVGGALTALDSAAILRTAGAVQGESNLERCVMLPDRIAPFLARVGRFIAADPEAKALCRKGHGVKTRLGLLKLLI